MPESASLDYNFNFTLTGRIESDEESHYLVCQDGTSLRLKKLPSEIDSTTQTWQVIPSTDSNGKIATVSIEPSSAAEGEGKCYVQGRVIQLGKRSPVVLFKVALPEQKPLKVSLVGPDPRMKTSQLWQVVASLSEDSLVIESASLLAEESPGDGTSLPQVSNGGALVLPEPKNSETIDRESLTAAALAALTEETAVYNWKLGKPRRRDRDCWEWEGESLDTGARARVQVQGDSWQVYQYGKESPMPAVEEGGEAETLSIQEQDRLSVIPLGAARGIGASCFQIQIGPYEVVLDCGTRPKGYDPLPALDYLKNPNLLLISHAHQDHLGGVPVFHRRYPGVRMICTPGTREIARIMLTDGLKLQQLNEDSPQLFDQTDLGQTLWRLETYPVGVDFEPLPGLKVRFINAGHILGAACIYLRYGERSLLYTGDFHTTNSRTTTGLRLADLPTVDVLITECTYGDSLHPARKTQETALVEAVAEVVREGGNVLIPAFALGRAQEILLALRTSALFHSLNVPVYVDGLVRAVTDVFQDNLELLPASVQNFAKVGGKLPFFEETGTPPTVPIQHRRERPLAMAKPSIIIASSGMLVGGPSVYYASVLLEREEAAIFISGYTDEESPGRLLQNLQTGDTIELDGRQITVKARVQRFNLSAHADKAGLGQVINRVNPQHLVLIHGSGDALHELARSGENRSKYYIHIPDVGEEIEYGVAPAHLSQERAAVLEQPNEFEIMVERIDEDVCLCIPEQVVREDPRWSILSGTGIIRAVWDGFNLKLKGVTQESLLRESHRQKAIASGEDCCAVCKSFNGRLCCGADSPLYQRPVDPGGICPEFEHLELEN